METLRCIVQRITFYNDENGYTVLRARARGFSEIVTLVGNMGSVSVGAVLIIKGEWQTDRKFGKQFAVREYEETLPATVHGIEKYLGSGLIKGVGPKFASLIVKTFGADTLNIIEETPDRLNEVPGIGQKRVEMIKEAWQEHKEIKNIMLFLQDHDVGTALAFKVFNEFGTESINIVKENPFRLTGITGIGFKTADTVARKMGFDKESEYRCKSGLVFVLNDCSNDGHCYMRRSDLIKKAAVMLEIGEALLDNAINEMLLLHDLILEPPDRIYVPPLFFCENGSAVRLKAILSGGFDVIDTEDIISAAEELSGVEYDGIQKDAIRIAAKSKIMILTGGPGTGKTTTVKGIIEVFRRAYKKILLAAPTGRAAKRLNEATGMEAKTIHRLLEAKPPASYQRNEDNKLDGDVLIIDESSMIDIVLMYNLLKAVPDEMTVIFVGDADQLPSVGPGNILCDMIESGAIPVVKLTHIFRQAMDSRIIMNAHCVNRGEFPDLSNKDNTDFFFVAQQDDAALPQTIVDLCIKRLPSHFKVKPSDIQVLCPMQRGENGVISLNNLLQTAISKSKKAIRRGGTEYRLGDKVMQVKNNYNKEVWNGDIGRIVSVDEEDRIINVSFDNALPVPYEASELDELVLAYAITVHKAQGSEYDIVVLPLTTQHYMMLQRNLLYTAITRAKKAVVIVGSKKAVRIAVKSNQVVQRNTGFAERLRT